ncbi:8-oxo-dGTP diphosphatase [Carnobacteriaceae bacterium zg-ZUI252]|nr:8-oxo-dGTP diphosphatase [Carnobacteriaceae bacterium zg-ZUI252]MBS4769548.1 8-oxo-dGTP diphosphatase [Carnobacteriaceae bacterium zg-ZUI240]QTU83016.1 8-oxo-dGTP diphosphatase [Carnobacteriaceae bacterium zg-C25]
MAVLTNMCMIQDTHTGKVLVQKREKSWKGLAFPGGHIELGESIQESVIREIKEETGLDVWDITLCGVKNFDYNNDRYVVFCYTTQVFSGELLEKTAEGELSWVYLNELDKSTVSPTFLDMLPLFFEDKQELYYKQDAPLYY